MAKLSEIADRRENMVVKHLRSGRALRVPAGMVTEEMIIERTGATKSKIRSLKARNILKSDVRNSNGWFLYKEEVIPKIIEEIQKDEILYTAKKSPKMFPAISCEYVAYTTEQALVVFEMIGQEKSINEIFLTTKLHPAILNTILLDYATLNQSIIFPKWAIDEINELTSLEGEFPVKTAKQIVSLLKIASKVKMCTQCRKKPHTDFCGSCAKKYIIQKIKSSNKNHAAVKSVDDSGSINDLSDSDT